MKIITDNLKNLTITTDAGNFKVNGDGVVDVPETIAQTLIQDGTFAELKSTKADKAEAVETKKVEAADAKADKKTGSK